MKTSIKTNSKLISQFPVYNSDLSQKKAHFLITQVLTSNYQWASYIQLIKAGKVSGGTSIQIHNSHLDSSTSLIKRIDQALVRITSKF